MSIVQGFVSDLEVGRAGKLQVLLSLCLKVLHSYFAGVRLNYMVADRNSSENHSDRLAPDRFGSGRLS